MPENRGLYKKYTVMRPDGKAKSDAAYFVLDVVNDPHAIAAIRGYRISCEGTLPDLADELFALETELSSGKRNGKMVKKLRKP